MAAGPARCVPAPMGVLGKCRRGADCQKGKVWLGSVLFPLIDLHSQSRDPGLAEEKIPDCRGHHSSCHPPSLLPVAAGKLGFGAAGCVSLLPPACLPTCPGTTVLGGAHPSQTTLWPW